MTLDQYDHQAHGPLLGVSNEGQDTVAIRHGALASPKCQVLPKQTPLAIGVAHDAERMAVFVQFNHPNAWKEEWNIFRLLNQRRLRRSEYGIVGAGV